MREHIRKVLASASDLDVQEDAAGNLTVIKGSGKGPCVVAHMDTVHPITGHGLSVVEKRGKVTAFDPITGEQLGVGGDDKCGIYAGLWIMMHAPSDGMAVFTVDEEVGCRGASLYDLDQIRHCDFLVQADRRGGRDLVIEALAAPICSEPFAAAAASLAEPWGFSRCVKGASTDVQYMVKAGVGISGVNLSAGYYNPHRPDEFIRLSDLARTVSLMLNLWSNLRGKQWKFLPG